MAGMKPGFITGANAKIKLFKKTVAFATDVSYNIIVQTIPIESMGKYEVHSNEPIAYTVDGTLSIIRYTSAATTNNIKDTAATKDDSPANIGDNTSNALSHFNPFEILTSQTFDVEIFQKIAKGTAATGATGVARSTSDDKAVFTVYDCRFTRRGMTLNKRGVMVDNYAFVGVLAQDSDSADYAVGNSGQEDLT